MTLQLNSEKETLEFLKNTDRPIILSCSGGKDSTAVGLLLKKHDIPFTPVFCDTGWENELTYHYVNETLPDIFGVDIITVKNEKLFSENAYGMETRILKYNSFPNGFKKWCTNELKLVAYRAYAVEIFLKTKKFPLNITGVRKDESFRRSKFQYVEEQDEATQIRPILEWSEDQVIEIHREMGAMPNPLYLKGLGRVGCWPCIYSTKGDIRKMADIDPDRIDYLEDLENKVSKARGHKTTFFQKGTIREAVSWSRGNNDGMTALFSEEELGKDEVGCFRWGLCEHNN